MLNKRLLILAGLAAVFLASTPADAWRHRMRSTIEADKNAQKHDTVIEHNFAVPTENLDSTFLCVAYTRNFDPGTRNQGNIQTVFEIHRFGGDFDNEPRTETVSLRQHIKANEGVACTKTNKALDKNDVILARHKFGKQPRMRANGEEPAFFRIFTSVSSEKLARADFFPEPIPSSPPDEAGGGGGGGGNEGGGGGNEGGGGNATDNRTAIETLRGCAGPGVGVQFKWENGRIWVDRRAPDLSVETIGPFGSFSEAANAARARWGCGAGVGATDDDGGQLPRLHAWGSVGGGRLLALRFEGPAGPEVYVDAYSSAIGAVHGRRFTAPAPAIRDFCGRYGC